MILDQTLIAGDLRRELFGMLVAVLAGLLQRLGGERLAVDLGRPLPDRRRGRSGAGGGSERESITTTRITITTPARARPAISGVRDASGSWRLVAGAGGLGGGGAFRAGEDSDWEIWASTWAILSGGRDFSAPGAHALQKPLLSRWKAARESKSRSRILVPQLAQ
jgi:hypothetical protein